MQQTSFGDRAPPEPVWELKSSHTLSRDRGKGGNKKDVETEGRERREREKGKEGKRENKGKLRTHQNSAPMQNGRLLFYLK